MAIVETFFFQVPAALGGKAIIKARLRGFTLTDQLTKASRAFVGAEAIYVGRWALSSKTFE